MRRVFFLLPLLLLASCASNTELPDEALVITPAAPQVGEVLSIVYNPHHRNAKFPDDAPYYATFNVIRETESDTYRILLHSKDSCYIGNFTVPDDALYIYVSVGPENVDQYAEHLASMVYDGEYPVRHAIPLLREATSYEEALEQCALDEELYPDCTDRALALWSYRLRAGLDETGLREEVDSVLAAVAQQAIAPGPRYNMNEFNALTGALYVYTMQGDFKNSVELSDLLLVSAGRIRECPTLASWSLDAVWRKMLTNLATSNDDRSTPILSAMGNLIEIALTLREDRLLDEIVQLDRSINVDLWCRVPAVRELVYSEEYWPRIKAVTRTIHGDDIIEYGQFIIHMTRAAFEKGEYAACIAIAEQHLPGLDTVNLWIRSDETLPVNFCPVPGWEAMVSYDRIQAYKHLHKDSVAIELMRNAARRKYTERYAWIIGRSMVELAERYAAAGNRDSAEQYLSWVLQIRTYDSKNVYEFVKKELHGSLPEPAALRMKYARDDLSGQIPCPTAVIETDRARYTLGKKFKGPMLLLFSSRTCPICRTVIPGMVRDVMKNYNKPPKIIIVTDEGKEYYSEVLKDCKNLNIEYAWFDPGVLMKFEQQAVPAFALISNGNIVESGPVGTMTWRALKKLEQL